MEETKLQRKENLIGKPNMKTETPQNWTLSKEQKLGLTITNNVIYHVNRTQEKIITSIDF